GEFRQPQIVYAAGEHQMKVDYTEHGCVFQFDVTKLMWSQGNMNERKRMYGNVQPGEVVVDFFCGMGYWSIPIAKHAKPKHVYAIDKNPDAIEAIRTNAKINRIPEKTLTIIHGSCTEEAPALGKIADRVIMGYIPAPAFALSAAFHVIKTEGGMIHYEGVCEEGKYNELVEDVKKEGILQGYECELEHAQQVKSYGPRRYHYTLDIRVKRL
ncbi:MAG: 50S ribosomal protein L11 methyltransferase, partial [archaeon]